MNHQTQSHLKHKLQCYKTLSEAIAAKERVRTVPFGSAIIIMVEDKVTLGGREVKQYLVGQLKQLFSYCIDMNDVRLHEVILSSAPSPLYFDIEIKKVETHGFGFPVYRKILRDMERRWCDEYEEEGL